MMRTALLTASLVACADQPPVVEPPSPTEVVTVQTRDVDHYIGLLNWPTIDPKTQVNYMHREGLRWILQHPDEAHPVLVSRLGTQRTVPNRIPDALAMLGRAEGVPPLERALWGDSESLAESAGFALGRHPHEDAFAALIRAIQSGTSHQVLWPAIEGLRRRKDPAACPALTGLLHHEDSNIRFYTLRACAELGCIEPAEIASFTSDPVKDVADLARGLVEGGQGPAQGDPAAHGE